eukprot:201936-Prorocentrum_minimum.AAC.2
MDKTELEAEVAGKANLEKEVKMQKQRELALTDTVQVRVTAHLTRRRVQHPPRKAGVRHGERDRKLPHSHFTRARGGGALLRGVQPRGPHHHSVCCHLRVLSHSLLTESVAESAPRGNAVRQILQEPQGGGRAEPSLGRAPSSLSSVAGATDGNVAGGAVLRPQGGGHAGGPGGGGAAVPGGGGEARGARRAPSGGDPPPPAADPGHPGPGRRAPGGVERCRALPRLPLSGPR